MIKLDGFLSDETLGFLSSFLSNQSNNLNFEICFNLLDELKKISVIKFSFYYTVFGKYIEYDSEKSFQYLKFLEERNEMDYEKHMKFYNFLIQTYIKNDKFEIAKQLFNEISIQRIFKKTMDLMISHFIDQNDFETANQLYQKVFEIEAKYSKFIKEKYEKYFKEELLNLE